MCVPARSSECEPVLLYVCVDESSVISVCVEMASATLTHIGDLGDS